ncbi:MAG: phage tail tape measure protein [Gallionellaceae bacterium]|jgi:TP901 family phage tail tape measure protein
MSSNLQLYLRINGDSSGLGRALSQGEAQINRFKTGTRSAFREMQQGMSAFYSQLNGFSGITRMASQVGVALSGRAAINGVVELERAMLVVKSNIMSGTDSAAELHKQLQQVRDTARELSGQTIFSDAQMVDLSGQLLKSGVNINGLKGASFGAASLAQLGGISPEQSASQLGALGNAFNFKTSDEYRALADQISRVDDASAMNSGMLLYNAQQVGATVASLKIDPKRMFAALGYLDPLGNEAGTSLNRFLGNMAGVTPHARKAIEATGMNFWQKNADGRTTLKDLGEVIEIVRKQFQGMKSDKEKKMLGHMLFGEEGERAASFFSSKSQSFGDFEERVKKSASAAEKLKVQSDGLGAAFSRLKNTAFAKFDTQFTPLRDGMKWATDKTTAGMDGGHLPEMLLGGAGALVAGRLAYKKWKGGKAGSMGEMGPMGAMGAQQVFVTNWPGSMLSPGEAMRQKRDSRASAPGGVVVGESATGTGRGALLKSGAMSALKWGAPLTAAMTSYSAWNISSDKELTAQQKKDEYKKLAGSATGSLIGGVAGGAIGGLFGGFGAVPGAMIGSALGGMLGDNLAAPDKNVMESYKQGSDAIVESNQKLAEAILNRPQQITVNLDSSQLASAVNGENSLFARRN